MAELPEAARLPTDCVWEAGFHEGYLAALQDYAWWQDGTQYVGCGAKTLEEAEKDLQRGKMKSADLTSVSLKRIMVQASAEAHTVHEAVDRLRKLRACVERLMENPKCLEK